jgi:cytochrome b pre-mRNA-processing protein 3
VALAERFVEAMDAEHRQIGIGEPTVGKKVRKMAALLGRKVELWRGAIDAGAWTEAARESLFGDSEPEWAALDHDRIALQSLWERFAVADLDKGEVW